MIQPLQPSPGLAKASDYIGKVEESGAELCGGVVETMPSHQLRTHPSPRVPQRVRRLGIRTLGDQFGDFGLPLHVDDDGFGFHAALESTTRFWIR